MAPLNLPGWFNEAKRGPCPKGGKAKPPGFIEKNLENIASIMKETIDSEEFALKKGALQGVDTRARIAGMLILILASGVTAHTVMLLGIIFLTVILARSSGVDINALAKRVLPSFIFTFALVTPVFFSFISPGVDILKVTAGGLKIAVTEEGVKTGLFFIIRVAAMVSLASLLLLTTRQSDFFKGLRQLPVPSFFVTALFMTFRHILILLKIAEDATFARKSRTITGTGLSEAQSWFASRITFILKRSLAMAEEVNMAMVSRGFTGKIKTFDNGALRGRDYLWIGFSSFVLFLSFGL